MGILTNPLSIPCCGNTFCMGCVLRCLEESDMCPTCRRKLLVSDLREAPRVVKNILEKFLQQNKVSERRDGPTFQVITYPVYAMFGTFRTRMETIEFNSEAINLTKIESNKQTLWYNIMVPFVHIQELLYCNSSDNSMNLYLLNRPSSYLRKYRGHLILP